MAYSVCLNCIRVQFSVRNISKRNEKLLTSYFSLKSSISHHVKSYSNVKTDKPLPSKEISNIYYGILTPQIKAVKVFSLITSITGCIVQPIIFQQADTIGGLPVLIAICTFVGFFTFVTPFLLHLVTKKYITHLEYNSETDEYIASVVTFFLRQRKIVFTPKDVLVPDVPGMFTSFTVKGTPLFVDPRLFQNPQHYARIMGYDKPIDFKLGENDKTSK